MRRLLPLIALAAPLAACATPLDAPQSPQTGLAVAEAIAAQTVSAAVDPTPPASSGRRASDATDRYHAGKVKPPAVDSASAPAASAPAKPAAPGQ
ncbi:MAG TPA: hypothetical protein VD929_01565 [Caulobacteraceae bacterium]|nr:hypothetical protein [Caulobacteraceae bacterium]